MNIKTGSLIVILSQALINTSTANNSIEEGVSDSEKRKQIISFSMDNDLFIPGQLDRDYTAGLALSYQNADSQGVLGSIDSILKNIDGYLNIVGEKDESLFEIGIFGFTPETIDAPSIDTSDRPYASLLYLSTSHIYRDGIYGNAWTTTFSIGMLGLDLFKSGQRTIHRLIGSDDARGWNEQISDGGELTARFQFAYHDTLGEDNLGDKAKFKASYFGSIGYLSEAGVAISFRNGLISSPDHRFNPAITSYGERSSASDSGLGPDENYFWGGIGLKARAYNAFLEGQFRRSAHTFSKDKLRPVIAELWAGYTLSLLHNIKLSYVFRAHSSEIRNGTGDRHLMWGGFIFSKAFN